MKLFALDPSNPQDLHELVIELSRVTAALHNFYRNVFGQKVLDEVK